mmetsp:Transcript_62722/g.149634  ORF Transcript_62722/g.149634 Transcript_62722/m.149634 type:complete len:632 (-) Transcript_62722:41-1936(-)|eukprot:CAMPEP_0178380230 /NCGR_PEP_ID=MMETSP0689_2-20121128/5353_1 /TAXON_ID=160604 /ORGANISM="Amphidinium massartii, Strain CS-259" /LENGTH=631 /DNA_ID=CAMNT_0020000361 /DNA_START=81 /DNA_END=1976 /DNA_ORIENTATION=+
MLRAIVPSTAAAHGHPAHDPSHHHSAPAGKSSTKTDQQQKSPWAAPSPKAPQAKDGKGNVIDTSRLSRREVLLHVYDVGDSSTIKTVNGWSSSIGGGVYHGGVEVYGTEWSYGFTNTVGTGVSWCVPRAHPHHAYRQTVDMGTTKLSERQVNELLEGLMDAWLGSAYHLLKHNCLDFCNALLKGLGLGSIPAWVDRYGRTAEKVGTVLYSPISAAKMAGGIGKRLAGGGAGAKSAAKGGAEEKAMLLLRSEHHLRDALYEHFLPEDDDAGFPGSDDEMRIVPTKAEKMGNTRKPLLEPSLSFSDPTAGQVMLGAPSINEHDSDIRRAPAETRSKAKGRAASEPPRSRSQKPSSREDQPQQRQQEQLRRQTGNKDVSKTRKRGQSESVEATSKGSSQQQAAAKKHAVQQPAPDSSGKRGSDKATVEAFKQQQPQPPPNPAKSDAKSQAGGGNGSPPAAAASSSGRRGGSSTRRRRGSEEEKVEEPSNDAREDWASPRLPAPSPQREKLAESLPPPSRPPPLPPPAEPPPPSEQEESASLVSEAFPDSVSEMSAQPPPAPIAAKQEGPKPSLLRGGSIADEMRALVKKPQSRATAATQVSLLSTSPSRDDLAWCEPPPAEYCSMSCVRARMRL